MSVPLLILLNPLRHEIEDLRFEVHRTALCRSGFGHQAGALEHLEVLRDRLHGDVVWRSQLAHRRVTDREARHDVASRRVGQRAEDERQVIRHFSSSTTWLINHVTRLAGLSTIRLIR